MASRSIGGIYASLSLKDTGFKAGLKSASEKLKSFGATSAKWAAVGAVGAGAGMAAGLVAGTKHTLSQVDALADLSAQTGLAVDDMMKLQQAYKDGGREAEMAGKDIGKMQKAIVGANNGGPDPFAPIGLSVKDLISMNPAQQFNAIGAAIMRISNPAERTAKAMEIFGKGGMGLTTVFGSIPQVEKALGRMPELAKKFAGAMGDANDLIGHLPLKSDQFFVGFTAGIIGELLPALEKIDNFDFTTIGQSLGADLATVFQSISDGSAWEIFELYAEKAVMGFGSNLANSGIIAAKTIGIAMEAAMAGGKDHMKNFDTFLGDKFVEMSSDPEIAKAWKDIKQRDIVSRNAAAGFSPLGGGGPDGPDFMEIFQKGLDEMKLPDVGREGEEARQTKIDKLTSEIAAHYQANSDAAAARSFKPGIENPIDPSSAQIPSIKESKEMVNDYQRRGLSLDGAQKDVKIDKQTNLLTEIRDTLKKSLGSNKELVW